MKYVCQSCGAPIEEMHNGIAKCESCGIKQTFPISDDERVINLLNRANKCIREMDYDAAQRAYESVFEYLPNNVEANWGIILCKYGVQYVKDEKTGAVVITCNRTLRQSIFGQPEFRELMSCASPEQIELYSQNAAEINALQQTIIAASSNRDPFDVFISYKETDDSGQRTYDSVKAMELYDELKRKGYRVFYSRVTLRDYAGSEYEPIIYSALTTARIMVLIGTSSENFNSPWVRNEWSRFFNMSNNDKRKSLVVCYNSIEDIPEQLRGIQAVNINELGWYQDINVYADRILAAPAAQKNNDQYYNSRITRGYDLINQMDWAKGVQHFDALLNEYPRDEKTIIGALLCKFRITSLDDLHKCFYENNINDASITFALQNVSPSTGNRIKSQQLIYNRNIAQKRIVNHRKPRPIPAIIALAVLIISAVIFINNSGIFNVYATNNQIILGLLSLALGCVMIPDIILFASYVFINKNQGLFIILSILTMSVSSLFLSIYIIIRETVGTKRYNIKVDESNAIVNEYIESINAKLEALK